MGSYIARRFITKYGGSVGGIIAVATGSRNLDDAEKMVALVSSIADEVGARGYSERLDELVLGKNFTRVKVGATDTSQMTEERRNRLRFRAGGYRDMFMLTLRLAKEEGFDSIPKDLPIGFFSGSEDLVGGKGEGVRNAAEVLRRYGLEPYVRIFDGMNHDILNEADCETVYGEILDWIFRCI